MPQTTQVLTSFQSCLPILELQSSTMQLVVNLNYSNPRPKSHLVMLNWTRCWGATTAVLPRGQAADPQDVDLRQHARRRHQRRHRQVSQLLRYGEVWQIRFSCSVVPVLRIRIVCRIPVRAVFGSNNGCKGFATLLDTRIITNKGCVEVCLNLQYKNIRFRSCCVKNLYMCTLYT